MLHKQFTERIEHISGVEPPFDPDSETLTGVLVDHTQHAEDLPVMGAILNEVIRPDMALVFRPEPDARAIIQPEPSSFGLLHWNLKPFTSPDAVDALLIHVPTIAPQQGRDPAIPISTMPRGKFDNGICQRLLVTTKRSWFALCGAMLADHAAGSAL